MMESLLMKIKVGWSDGMSFIGTSDSGHQIVMDAPAEFGGLDNGPRPMEMLLLGVGGCASFDVVHILKKSHQDITACVAELIAKRVNQVPSVFESIDIHFKVSGRSLDPRKVERAVRLSAETYCSASIMMGRAGVLIEHSHSIVESV